MKNSNLHRAKRAKNDEFYTLYSDIEAEVQHYNFRGQRIYCNCDSPLESEFVHFFVDKFVALGLKSLTATSYSHEHHQGQYFHIEFPIDYGNIGKYARALKGDGDFRSEECIELLKESDVVVTNPPFSLFSEYITQLFSYGKKFLIMGNKNASIQKNIFPLFMRNELWFGVTLHSGDLAFKVPKDMAETIGKSYREGDIFYARVPAVHWFTNLESDKKAELLGLTHSYNEADYPKYDNFDAIEVSKTSDIPFDYSGIMGVPITFLDKYDKEQFEIVGIASRGANSFGLRTKTYTKLDSKNYHNLNGAPVLKVGGALKGVYTRIFIRNRHLQTEVEHEEQ